MESCGREPYLSRKVSNSIAFREDLHIYRNNISNGQVAEIEGALRDIENEEARPFGPVLREEIRVCFNNIAEGKCKKYPAPPITPKLAL